MTIIYILLILIGLSFIGLIRSIILEKNVDETICPKCKIKLNITYIKMGDIGFGIRPTIKTSKCKKCEYIN